MGDATVLAYCHHCGGSIDTDWEPGDYVTDGDGTFWCLECTLYFLTHGHPRGHDTP